LDVAVGGNEETVWEAFENEIVLTSHSLVLVNISPKLWPQTKVYDVTTVLAVFVRLESAVGVSLAAAFVFVVVVSVLVICFALGDDFGSLFDSKAKVEEKNLLF
jgi:hypothetical protein